MKSLGLLLVLAGISVVAAASVPARIHYQAKLTGAGGAPLTGTHTLFIALYQGGDAQTTTGTLVYKESVALPLANGVVSHEFGTGTPLFGTALLSTMFDFNGDMFIGVGVDSDANQVLPRNRLDSVPFAMRTADNTSCYGDGSAGAKNVTVNQGTSTLSANGNYQFTDLTITAGHTLTVESGTILRCTGTFTVLGTLNVSTGAKGGQFNSPAHPGVSKSAAGIGRDQINSVTSSGGLAGEPLSAQEARNQLLVGPTLGGGAGGGDTHTGLSGGGSVLVLARNTVICSGTINANGQSNVSDVTSGGGAGGVVILASAGTVSVTGTINANGGTGAPSAGTSGLGAGGGGGGGIVHLLAPTLVTLGTINVTFGTGGAGDGMTNSGNHRGGGGGGACGGRGGAGGGFSSTNGALDGTNGQVGQIVLSNLDPTALFR